MSKEKRRAAAAVLLRANSGEIATWPNGEEVWKPLRHQLAKALDLLEKAGLFILRHGIIEDHYASQADLNDKVGSAAVEADAILEDPFGAQQRHAVVLRALQYVSPALPVDESAAVRVAFNSVVGPAILHLRENSGATTEDLRAVAERHPKDVASLFNIDRIDRNGRPAIEVRLAASVLDVAGFPVIIHPGEDVATVALREIRRSA